MVLIGKTGHEKSETANTICERTDFFSAKDSARSHTTGNQTLKVTIGGRRLRVVDTPGCMDTKKGDSVLKDISDAITTSTEGYDAFLITMR